MRKNKRKDALSIYDIPPRMKRTRMPASPRQYKSIPCIVMCGNEGFAKGRNPHEGKKENKKYFAAICARDEEALKKLCTCGKIGAECRPCMLIRERGEHDGRR